jgi:antitoxin component of RelBE/YafQ-DinJ toxin-antitoxin module
VTEAGLRIRVDDNLRRDFIETCKSQDATASQVLRAFMRNYVEQHGAAVRQGHLFDLRISNREPPVRKRR